MKPAEVRRLVGDTLRVERLRRRITQHQLAEQMVALGYLDWRQRTVSDIEKGRRNGGRRAVSIDEGYGLALILGLRPSDVFAQCFAGPLEYDDKARPIPAPIVNSWLNNKMHLELIWNPETKRHGITYGVMEGIDSEALLALLTHTGAQPRLIQPSEQKESE